MGGGTEAFTDLGMHCQLSDCGQLNFFPFKCNGCGKVFCLEHRSHKCPRSYHNSRKVLVCETCSMSIETSTGLREGEYLDEKAILEKHQKSGDCDPSKKKKKPTCAVRRCKEILTFSNAFTCKSCLINVCIGHSQLIMPATKPHQVSSKDPPIKFLAALTSMNIAQHQEQICGM